MGKLIVNNLSYSYEKNKNVLQNVSFELNSGEHLSIIGHSGCGKTTLIKLIQGSLNLDDKTKIKNNFKELSYVPQSGNLLPYLTIEQNLELHYKLVNKQKLTNKNLLTKVMNSVNLELSLLKKYPRELSGGQKQRASIANALINEKTDLLIFDESFSALDEITRFDIQNTLMSIIHKNRNLAILEITHNIDEALISSDRIIHLDNGIIKFNGTPNDLYFRNKLNEETKNLVWKSNLSCEINWDAWRISALKKMDKLNTNVIKIIDDNNKLLGLVYKNDIEKSMGKTIKSLADLISNRKPTKKYVRKTNKRGNYEF